MKTGQVVSVETLVRWSHPRFGAIAAPDIVQAAEGANLILPMTLAVLDRACLLRQQLSSDAPRMAVNLSPALLSIPNLAGSIADVLAKRNCPAESVIFELTEDAAMSLSDTVVENLEALRAAGSASRWMISVRAIPISAAWRSSNSPRSRSTNR